MKIDRITGGRVRVSLAYPKEGYRVQPRPLSPMNIHNFFSNCVFVKFTVYALLIYTHYILIFYTKTLKIVR